MEERRTTGLAHQRPAFIDVISPCAAFDNHDLSVMKPRKTHPEYDPTDRINAMTNIQAHAAKGEVLTGLLYVNPDSEDLHAHLNTYKPAFNTLGAEELCPASGMLEKINAALR